MNQQPQNSKIKLNSFEDLKTNFGTKEKRVVRTYDDEYKAKVIFEKLNNNLTLLDIKRKYGVPTNTLAHWIKQAKKKKLKERKSETIFSSPPNPHAYKVLDEHVINSLTKENSRLKEENLHLWALICTLKGK